VDQYRETSWWGPGQDPSGIDATVKGIKKRGKKNGKRGEEGHGREAWKEYGIALWDSSFSNPNENWHGQERNLAI